MNHDSHPNSKKITIFRAGGYLSRTQGAQTEEYFANSKASVGSYYERNSNKVGSGLSYDEQELLMPLVVDTEPTDRQFREKVKEFYIDLDTKIPYGTGLTLEIGLTVDNNAPLSKKNMPLSVMEYIRYRVAKEFPFMAQTKKEADSNPQAWFYIFDKDSVNEDKVKSIEQRDAAMHVYLQIKSDKSKVDQMLGVLGIDPRTYQGKNAFDDKTNALRQAAETNPADFIKKYEEADLEVRYWIQMMTNTKVIKQMGQKYVDGETNKTIANSLEELVFFFKDESNSDEVGLLKARMQELMSKPITTGTRKTQFLAAQS